MADSNRPPLNWESSAASTHAQICSNLPSEVEACLKNARFVGIIPREINSQTYGHSYTLPLAMRFIHMSPS